MFDIFSKGLPSVKKVIYKKYKFPIYTFEIPARFATGLLSLAGNIKGANGE
jgi:hypothetical protein